jgi:hypothetical protein
MKKIILIISVLLTLQFTPSISYLTSIHIDQNTALAEITDPGTEGDPITDPGLEERCAQLEADLAEEGSTLEKDLNDSIVPCGRLAHQCDDDESNDQCKFDDIFTLINRMTTRFITVVFAPLLTIVLMYIGFLFIKEGAPARIKAKQLLFRVLIGTFFVLGAWLIINFILSALGAESALSKYLNNN